MMEFNNDFNAITYELDNILKDLVSILNILGLELLEKRNLHDISTNE
jgi:hypothetical protein